MARVALVTGSTDGIGRQTARELASRGMRVILHGRSKLKVDAAVQQLLAELPGADLDGVTFDLGSLAAVRRGAEQILAKAPELHVLVNNAGVFVSERVVTDDQIELSFAVNHIGPFLLTHLLLDRLVESAKRAGMPSRVVNVASIAHTRGAIDPADLAMEKSFSGYAAYGRGKLANVMHAIGLAERADPKELVAFSLHPGVVSTKLLRQGFGPVQGTTVAAGAKHVVRLAAEEGAPAAPSGTYFNESTATQPSAAARDPKQREALWGLSVRLAKL